MNSLMPFTNGFPLSRIVQVRSDTKRWFTVVLQEKSDCNKAGFGSSNLISCLRNFNQVAGTQCDTLFHYATPVPVVPLIITITRHITACNCCKCLLIVDTGAQECG